jgi:adenylosuccinate synthase
VQGLSGKFRGFIRDLSILNKAKPVYQQMPGWPKPADTPKRYSQLHPNARAYLSRLQDILKVKISMVSVGSGREETISV